VRGIEEIGAEAEIVIADEIVIEGSFYILCWCIVSLPAGYWPLPELDFEYRASINVEERMSCPAPNDGDK
jgi:hypothetical protein